MVGEPANPSACKRVVRVLQGHADRVLSGREIRDLVRAGCHNLVLVGPAIHEHVDMVLSRGELADRDPAVKISLNGRVTVAPLSGEVIVSFGVPPVDGGLVEWREPHAVAASRATAPIVTASLRGRSMAFPQSWPRILWLSWGFCGPLILDEGDLGAVVRLAHVSSVAARATNSRINRWLV